MRRHASPPSPPATPPSAPSPAESQSLATADALLLDHRRLVAQARSLLARPSTRNERLALADDLIALIDRLGAEKRAFALRINRGRAANAAINAYGRAMATKR
ncbi:hypothetical protein VY88_31570 [Azospirillum thiophilum]|uniref:hypothetical protein n=1 Tax=Azospirillum thiophilum TaxID=528244 RepID=UPI00061E4009|nr:hypothetical protein [Azospirillum thiophilum]KJR61265.1 hypothetical protein VY88_31570 [Azospirillum thiophilum]